MFYEPSDWVTNRCVGCGEWTAPRYRVMLFAGALGQHGPPQGTDGGCARPSRQGATGGISPGETNGGLRETVSTSPWPLVAARLRLSNARRTTDVACPERAPCLQFWLCCEVHWRSSVGLALFRSCSVHSAHMMPAHLYFLQAGETKKYIPTLLIAPPPATPVLVSTSVCRHSERLEKQAGVVVTHHPLKHTQWYT